jgi:hypothetical protein
VLVRTGKNDEAFEICEQVKKVIPTDEATLQAVTMALKELGKREYPNPMQDSVDLFASSRFGYCRIIRKRC